MSFIWLLSLLVPRLVQAYRVELSLEPAPEPLVDPVAGSTELAEVLDALLYLNREAASQVGQGNPAAAVRWLEQSANDLPQAGRFTARQREIFKSWKQALERGAAEQVQASTHANAVLYADMLWALRQKSQ